MVGERLENRTQNSREGREGRGEGREGSWGYLFSIRGCVHPSVRPSVRPSGRRTVGRMTMKSTRGVLGQWAIRSSIRLFARTAHSFACCALLASLASSAALIRSLARSLAHFKAHGKETFVYKLNASISYSFNPLCVGPSVRNASSLMTTRRILCRVFGLVSTFLSSFLDTSTHLCKRVCLSVGPSVCPSVRPSIRPSVGP